MMILLRKKLKKIKDLNLNMKDALTMYFSNKRNSEHFRIFLILTKIFLTMPKFFLRKFVIFFLLSNTRY